MSNMFDMSVLGLDVITDFMEECQKNEQKLIRKATITGARVILKAAKANCPSSADGNYSHEKGNLKKSLKIKAVKPKDRGKQLVVIGPEVGKKAKNDGWYGRLVENGTSKTAPNPFLRPAFDNKQNEAYNTIAEVYTKEWGNKTIADDIETFGDVLIDSLGGG